MAAEGYGYDERVSRDQRLSQDYSDLKVRYEELKRVAFGAKAATILSIKRGKEIDRLEEEVKQLKEKLEHKKQQKIEGLEPLEGAVVLQVDTYTLGAFVPQAKYIKVLEELKKLKNEYSTKGK